MFGICFDLTAVIADTCVCRARLCPVCRVECYRVYTIYCQYRITITVTDSIFTVTDSVLSCYGTVGEIDRTLYRTLIKLFSFVVLTFHTFRLVLLGFV